MRRGRNPSRGMARHDDPHLRTGGAQPARLASANIQRSVDLPGRFSNTRPALRTLIRRVLTDSQGRGSHQRRPERHDTRGPVVRNSVRSQTRLGPAKRAELVADYEAGMMVRAISEKYGLHRSTIPAVLHREGVTVRTAGLNADERAQAASLYESGMTLTQVAHRMGIGDDAARRAVLDEGGWVRPRGRRPKAPAS